MGLMPASYKVTARSVSRVLGDGRRQGDRSLKGHEAGVRKGQPWAVNHYPGIVAVYQSSLAGRVLPASRRSALLLSRPKLLGCALPRSVRLGRRGALPDQGAL